MPRPKAITTTCGFDIKEVVLEKRDKSGAETICKLTGERIRTFTPHANLHFELSMNDLQTAIDEARDQALYKLGVIRCHGDNCNKECIIASEVQTLNLVVAVTHGELERIWKELW